MIKNAFNRAITEIDSPGYGPDSPEYETEFGLIVEGFKIFENQHGIYFDADYEYSDPELYITITLEDADTVISERYKLI